MAGVGGRETFLRRQGLGWADALEEVRLEMGVTEDNNADVAKGSKCSGGPGSRRPNAGCGAGLASTHRVTHTWQARGGSRAEPGNVEMQGAPSRYSARLGAGG